MYQHVKGESGHRPAVLDPPLYVGSNGRRQRGSVRKRQLYFGANTKRWCTESVVSQRCVTISECIHQF